MRFASPILHLACLVPLVGAAWTAEVSEVRLRSGEVIYGRVLQEDSSWVVIDIEGGTITSIERARIQSIQPAGSVATTAPSTSTEGKDTARARGWAWAVDLAWGWSTYFIEMSQTIRDHGVNNTYRLQASRDANGFDDALTCSLRLQTDVVASQNKMMIFGVQGVMMPGDIINPEVPVWSIEALGGIRWGRKITFDLRGSGGFAFASGEVRGIVGGSQGYQPFSTTDTAMGAIVRAEGSLGFWIGDSASIDLKLGGSHRQLLADIEYKTRTYSGEIEARSSATAAYIGLGLTVTF
ncbi:MAG: hypothetical protein RMM29_08445 [Planctomycetota bacterium]|nr:hypothetical protein [Planctomycetota bacterium]